MKVALYVHDMRASGVVRAMIALARFLAERGDEAILVAGSKDGHFSAADVAPARFVAATVSLPGPLPRLRVVRPLRAVLRAVDPDIVVSGGNHGHVGLWAATRGLGIPLVFVFSNPMDRAGQPLRGRWRLFKSRMLIAASTRSIVVGKNLAADRAFAPGIARGKVVLINNGIDLAPVRSGVVPAIPAPMAGAIPVVLAIGRLHPQKNFEGLIDAVADANRIRPLRLVVLGDGKASYREALLDRAHRQGIGDLIEFAGVTDDVYAWLRAARVFALSSHYEGGPSLVLLEAMAAGIPVVAHESGSDAAHVLDDGRYGLLADAHDPVAFAAALLRQAGDEPVLPGDRVLAYDCATMHAAYRELLAAACRAPAKAPQPVSTSATALPPSVAQAPPMIPSGGSSTTSSTA